MKNEEWCITLPEDKSVIKVGSPDRENGRVPYPGVSLWAKRFWRIVYWWRIHCQTPNWKSPQWVALGCALLLMVAVVAVTSAYLIEPARRQPVAGRSSASGGSTVDGRGELGTAVPPSLYATASTIYVVQPEDTLYRIASHYGTTIDVLDQVNQLNNTISVGQVLVIPSVGRETGATAVLTDQYACAQFSFLQAGESALAGVYALHDVSGGQIAAWSAPRGAVTSGWIYDLPVAFASVHTRVLFYPRYGGGTAVEMTILNHAPDTTAGWLTRGLCHSLELAYASENGY